jgi:2-oxoglutarate ferredoxin oxidoreductase subunit beta
MQKSMAAQELDPANVVVCSGIGCSGRTPAFVKCYGFHGLHGRVLPTATGIKLANPSLTVIAVGGDGDGLAIGGGHFPHACRRNVDITYLLLDNNIYGLTKGQFSPTSQVAESTASTPYGNVEAQLDPVELAMTYGATFVARAFSGNPNHMAQLLTQAIQHKGFAFLHVISPCLTFAFPYDYYAPKVQMLPEDHDPRDRMQAMQAAMRADAIPIGLFYKQEGVPDLTARMQMVQETALKRGPGDLQRILAQFE